MLGFSSEEVASLIKAFSKTTFGVLSFMSGHLEVSLGKDSERRGFVLNLAYEKGGVLKTTEYSYDLRLLDTLLCRRSDQTEGDTCD
jgi:hypothetical protein